MKKHNLFKGLFTCLLALVLVAGTFASSAKAAETAPAAISGVEYQANTDSIQSDTAGVVYVLKAEKNNKVKASDTCYDIATSSPLSLVEDLKIKSTVKDVYLYVCDKAFEEDTDNITANVVIKAQIAKKLVATIDYTKADTDAADGVVSVKVTDKDKKEVKAETISLVWASEQDGTFAGINDTTNGFLGKNLKEMLENGGTIYVKMLGSNGNPGVRTSQAYKVKVAKQAKAPKIKIDVKKNSIALKNGYDFAYAVENAASDSGYDVDADAWQTILPFNKDAKNAVKFVPTAQFTPGDKENTAQKNAVLTSPSDTSTKLSFTKTQVKTYSLKDMSFKVSGETKDLSTGFSLAIRVSATAKKPASAVTYCTIAAQAKAPQIYTIENCNNYYTIAKADKFSLVTPEIVNYVSAWTAEIGAKVAVDASATKDEAAPKYEMAVIKATDLENADLDWSSIAWKSIKPGTKITEKIKTKYVVAGKTVEATLKAEATKITVEDSTGVKSTDPAVYLLIRRAGVKAKTIDDSVVASDVLKTYVYKDGKQFGWDVVKEAADQVLVGGKGDKRTVTVKTWNGTGYTANDSKQLTKWIKADGASEEKVELPAVDGYAYFDTDDNKIITGNVDVTAADVTVTLKQRATLTINGEENSTELYVGDTDKEITLTAPTGKTTISRATGATKVDGSDDKIKISSVAVKNVVTVEWE